MIKPLTLLFLAFAATLSAKEPTPKVTHLSEAKLAAVDAKIQSLIDNKKMAGCVVAVSHRGNIAYHKAFGMADSAAEKLMEKDTIFRIFSMSKGITSACAMMLVEEGKISLDDPVSKHLPQLKNLEVYGKDGNVKPQREPTIRDLLRHTAGFGYGWSGNAVDNMYAKKGVLGGSLEELITKLSELPLHFEPGTKWMYGVSTDVLGRVIEVVSGKSLNVFFKDRVFDPLDMPDTSFQLPKEKVDRFSANYSGKLDIIDKPAESKYLNPPKMLSGGGGLVSTTSDYMRFLQMIANQGELDGKRLLKEKSVKLMSTNQLPDSIPFISIGGDRKGVGFGLGFSVITKEGQFDTGAVNGEFGWGGAASTHYWISPKDELIVVAMQQQMPFTFVLEFSIKKLIYDAFD
jgi:CubicO group peptidase (beta-lactamase class C family)